MTLCTVIRWAPLSTGFSRQEYWSGLPFPPPGDLPDPAIEPTSPVAPALAGRFFTIEPPGKSTVTLFSLFIWLNWANYLTSSSTDWISIWIKLEVIRHAEVLAWCLTPCSHSLNVNYNFMNMKCWHSVNHQWKI